ncbi:hypothetical protein K450DRAFT_219300 [Umbelopsis ramanniana AG]|uniref:Uncharacterized protein n=1 Tax=Umbelopsis ramanniana AG TaxID=1314678 RepID=A0AAD5EIT2_UMBRA|nr:uncharacterized protein K450DRAFT_219300 [Umbelopsis ramanniana AG]KAI8584319.1 hypothetical protein K450DRAFT_219300 [Umbelopsis ramanniana AG]
MAAETRYPSRRRSSRQTSQQQQNVSESPVSMPAAAAPMSHRTRSNITQFATPAAPSVLTQSPTTPRSVNHTAADPSVAFTNASKEDSTAPYEEQPTVDPNLASTSEYRRADKNKILWYATPPVNITPLPQPVHSAKYLYWKRMQNQQEAT